MTLTSPSTEILLALDPAPDSAGVARRAVRRGIGSADMEHTVSLLVSELVGNAVRHADLAPEQRIVLFARMADDFVHVEVADPGDGFDPEVRHDAEGFGLRLVDTLATSWGVERSGTGCRVWFDVDRRRRRFLRDASA